MKAERYKIAAADLGFGQSGHIKRLTHFETAFLGIFWVDHSGPDNKIAGGDVAVRLAYRLTGHQYTVDDDPEDVEFWGRWVRHLQNHILQYHDIPLLSKSGNDGGYWLAETEEEGVAFRRTFFKRGRTGFVKGTCGNKAVAVEAFEQLAFEFEDVADKAYTPKSIKIPRVGTRNASDSVAPMLVDSMLAKMTRNPEKFADTLRNLREKYFSGGVLLDKARLSAMRAKTRELTEMVAGLEK